MSSYLVDSDVAIWATRRKHGVEQALAQIIEQDADLLPATSAVTAYEMFQGMRDGEEARHRRVLEQLECLPVTGAVAEIAAALTRRQRKQGRTLNLADAIVAATALLHDLTLVTYNRRHFEPLGVRCYERLPAITGEG